MTTATELADLLSRLIAIPSVNPAHTDDASIAGERRMAEFTAEFLNQRGFDVFLDETDPERPNVIGSYGPRQAERTVMLESHLDTVGVHNMTRPPFEARIEGKRLYGRGACDTKGPMAAALGILQPEWLDRLAAAGGRLLFIGAMGEERGNLGAEALVDKKIRADEAIVLEPTELAIVHAHKGVLWYRIEVTGVPAHGSNPERGVNAILGMNRVIEHLQEQIAKDQRERTDPVLGLPTLNIGMIEGGTALNVVPARCILQVDRRTLPSEKHEQVLSDVRTGLTRLKEQGFIKSFDLGIVKEGTPFSTFTDSALVKRLKKSCEECGVRGWTEGAAWYSDAGPFSQTCREIIVFGPGSIRQAHTVDEYIELDALEKGAHILRKYFESLIDELKQGGAR